MALYELSAPAFIAPDLLPAGTKISTPDSWEPGPHCIPLDDAAHAAMEKYEAKLAAAGAKLETALHPVEALPVTVVEAASGKAEEVVVTLAESQASKAEAGPTDGGKVK